MDDMWLLMYEKAKKYYEEYGNLNIKLGYLTDDGTRLGLWIKIQKEAYQNRYINKDEIVNHTKPLTDEQVSLLESIGIIWNIRRSREINWYNMYEHAKRYYEEHGNLNIKLGYLTDDGYRLGRWIQAQKSAYKNRFIKKEERVNTLSPLTDEKVSLLEKIGMLWDTLGICEADWYNMYVYAKKYYEEYGNLYISKNYIVDDLKLGIWLNMQRTAFKKGKLAQEKIDLLNSIGIIWSSFESEWKKKYGEAKKYYEEHGNLNVKIYYVMDNGCKLGRWIQAQRYAYKIRFQQDAVIKMSIKPLSDEKIELLNNIGMIWDLFDENWIRNYRNAKKYYEEFGNLLVPYGYTTEDGCKLGHWIKAQRSAYQNRFRKHDVSHNNLLTDEQVRLLENIGMFWNLYDAKWQINYEKSKEYFELNGNLSVPQDYVTDDGIRLGAWISSQKEAYKNRYVKREERKNSRNPLTDEQVVLLESVGMIWDKKEYAFITRPLTQSGKLKLEKRFLEFLSDYIKDNKCEIESYEDVKNISDMFVETLGSEENHYRKYIRK